MENMIGDIQIQLIHNKKIRLMISLNNLTVPMSMTQY